MGVTVREVMASKFFKKCDLIAGAGGLDREIQAVALFDAPDGYLWFKGKEFVLTTGYLFQQHEGLFRDVVLFLSEKNSAGIAIKVDRFLKEIPQDIINLCNEINFPLISLPYETAWIDAINAVNSLAMNKYIIRINEHQYKRKKNTSTYSLAKKANEVLEILHHELGKHILLFDILEDKAYSFPNIPRYKELHYQDLIDPVFSYQKEIICEHLKIYRIKNLEDKQEETWVTMPIVVGDIEAGYLLVKEDDKKIDYYNIFSLRLAFTLLVYIYEQVYYMNSIDGKFQDEFLQEIIYGEYKSNEKIYKRANSLKLNIAKSYLAICIQQDDESIQLDKYREKIAHRIYQVFSKDKVLFGLLEENRMVILYAAHQRILKNNADIKQICQEFILNLQKDILNSRFRCGIGQSIESIVNIKKSYMESIKAIEIGTYIYPEKNLITYKELGPFRLIRRESFQGEDFKEMTEDIAPLLEQDDGEDLLLTLKTYLESESNYNLAARRLFIHSNTVRYRIEKIQQLCDLNLNDATERLKLEITLKFMKFMKHT
ncbi:sugar diacid utilization regulator [Clostridium aceticum]|uniref:Sugar diacid utilization regulator n=1 Tax=Clostridium aceticum TaxID=84022 RepID=A0A0D8I9H9_9CLOT|nr:PucR family transcriptional regulator [Clostridium aceticum]AKL95730.1 sugar diacid utilization regulator [Clostridium aceticum]KJF26719.1 hypothetical protein TZ02_10845 [Clostridium aceticum]